jgi:hypothetical protein
MNIAPLNQALADMQKDTAVRKASARYHRSSHVYITLYTDQALADSVAKELLLQGAIAVTDPETLLILKHTYLDRVGLRTDQSWYYEVNPHLFDREGYAYFDISIYLEHNKRVTHYLRAHGMEGNENFDQWLYRSNITGENYALTLSVQP